MSKYTDFRLQIIQILDLHFEGKKIRVLLPFMPKSGVGFWKAIFKIHHV